jgi:hypothetical protein
MCMGAYCPVSNEASTGGQEAVGWDGQLGGNPAWPLSSIVLTVCGCHAAGNEVSSVARFGQQQQRHSQLRLQPGAQ